MFAGRITPVIPKPLPLLIAQAQRNLRKLSQALAKAQNSTSDSTQQTTSPRVYGATSFM